MVEQIHFLVAGAIGIGPALFLLWHSLRRFDYPRVEKTLFDDRKVFFALAVGLVFGTISSLVSLYSQAHDLAAIIIVLLVVILFEESFKLVYLNRKGYRMNFASTFYGFSLGVGVAATVMLATGLRNPDLPDIPLFIALLIVFSISMNATEAMTGALIGYGCSKGEPWSHFFTALFARFFYTFVALPFLLAIGDEWIQYLSLFAALAVAIYLYHYSYYEILPETLPPELRRLLRKARKARIRARKG